MSKDQANSNFKTIHTLLISRTYPKTAQVLNDIIQDVNNMPDLRTMPTKFNNLVTTFIEEYSVGNKHRIQCAAFYTSRWCNGLIDNREETNKVLRSDEMMENRKNRIKAFQTLDVLYRITMTGSVSLEEKLTSLSLLYGFHSEGIYGKELRDCCMWDMLSRKCSIDTKGLLNMRMTSLTKYVEKLSDGICLLEGWDDNIRNSIAHASFYHDNNKQKMIYEDRIGDITKEKSFAELWELYTRQINVSELTRLMDQMLVVNDCIAAFKPC